MLGRVLELCEQVRAQRSAGVPNEQLIDQMSLSLVAQEAADEFAVFGRGAGPRMLRQRWLLGIVSHADGERHFADAQQVVQAAQTNAFGLTQLPPNFGRPIPGSGAGSRGPRATMILEAFIGTHTAGEAEDQDACYLRAYLHVSRAVLRLARGEDPVPDIGRDSAMPAEQGCIRWSRCSSRPGWSLRTLPLSAGWQPDSC